MISVFLADGFEEIEALTPVDLLRRAGLTVETVGIGGFLVRGAHGIQVECDRVESEFQPKECELVILPGGMPGAANLEASAMVREALLFAAAHNRRIAAICAAPGVLGRLGLLRGRRYTCYPGFESEAFGGVHTASLCERDGNLITAKGPGAALAFALCLVEELAGAAKSQEIERSLQCR